MRLLFIMLAAVLLGGPAVAQSIVSTGQSFVSARLLPGEAHGDGSRMAGLKLTVMPGWKTYWRAPGRAGIPPRFDWSASRNVASVEVLWPRPYLFESFGMRTVGYDGDVVLPLRVVPERPGEAMHLALTAELGVCREICVLEEVSTEEPIPAGLQAIGSRQIKRALRKVPAPAAELGVHMATCRITSTDMGWALEASIASDRFSDPPEVLVEGSEKLWVYFSSSETAAGVVTVLADLQTPSGTTWVDRKAVRFTVLGETYAADIQGCAPTAG